jgi:hypothetical protein
VSGSAAAQTAAAVSGCGRTAADRQPPLRRDGGTAQVRFSCLRWSSGQVDAAAENGCRDGWTPGAAWRTPGARTPWHCGHPRPPQGMGTLRQRPRWAAGSRTVHHPGSLVRPERDPNVRHRPARQADHQIRSLPVIVRLVVCGPSVLLTSQNLVLPVRLVCCGPSVGLSSSVKNSVNDGLQGLKDQILHPMLRSARRPFLGYPHAHPSSAPFA